MHSRRPGDTTGIPSSGRHLGPDQLGPGYRGRVEEAWIEHRRGLDRELVGWMKPVDDGFVVVDLLGRPRSEVVDWLRAEELLDAIGLGYLAEPFELRLETGQWQRVRITEVMPTRIRLQQDYGGAVGAPQVVYDLPNPAPPGTLRRAGDG